MKKIWQIFNLKKLAKLIEFALQKTKKKKKKIQNFPNFFGVFFLWVCSHQVLKMFTKFPIYPLRCSQFAHFLSHKVWPWLNFHVYKLQIMHLFWSGKHIWASMLEGAPPLFSKYW
jgi:hypothetical protein